VKDGINTVKYGRVEKPEIIGMATT